MGGEDNKRVMPGDIITPDTASASAPVRPGASALLPVLLSGDLNSAGM